LNGLALELGDVWIDYTDPANPVYRDVYGELTSLFVGVSDEFNAFYVSDKDTPASSLPPLSPLSGGTGTEAKRNSMHQNSVSDRAHMKLKDVSSSPLGMGIIQAVLALRDQNDALQAQVNALAQQVAALSGN
jgi:hypothetical protein